MTSQSATDRDAPASALPAFLTSPGYRRWLLVLLALIYTSNFVDRQIFATLNQAIKHDLGLTDTQIGMLGGLAFAAFYTFLGIPIARLAERVPRIPIMTAAVAIWSVMTACCGLAQSFVQMAAARVGVGVGEAGCLPCAHSLISDHYPASKRASALAVFSLGIPAGSLIGAVAGGWIAQNMSWRLAFIVVGLPGLVLALIALATLKEPPRGYADGVDAPAKAPSLLAVLKRLWSRPAALWVCGGATLAATAGYGILNFVAAYFVRRFGFDYTQTGLAAGAISGVGAGISVMSGGLLTDWIARRDRRAYAWVSIVGLLVGAPLYVLGFMQTDAMTALGFLVLGAASQQLYLAPTFATANIVAEPRMRATSIALLSFVWNLVGLGFGPVIVGAASDRIAKGLVDGSFTDVLGLCRKAACADASATGLQYALISITVLFLAGAALFLVSSRTMRRDLA
jgi:predicted MFS family arabinose efflux permease